MPLDWIIPDVLSNLCIVLAVKHSHLRESFLPEGRSCSNLLPRPKSKLIFDELYGAFNGDVAFDRDQQVEMIWNDNPFMQSELSLGTIMVKNFDEQSGRTVGLQQKTFLLG